MARERTPYFKRYPKIVRAKRIVLPIAIGVMLVCLVTAINNPGSFWWLGVMLGTGGMLWAGLPRTARLAAPPMTKTISTATCAKPACAKSVWHGSSCGIGLPAAPAQKRSGLRNAPAAPAGCALQRLNINAPSLSFIVRDGALACHEKVLARY